MNIFHSARLKLTGFYLAVLVVFSLCLTIGVRTLAQHELAQSNTIQRGVVRQWIVRFYDEPTYYGPPDAGFRQIQEDQEALIARRLNQDLIIMNVVALVIGGVVSWWYAGRTLRPIEAAHEAQKRFASDASHELRTPLTNLRLENEVFLRQKDFSEAEARELIRSNLEEVQRLEHLSTYLLALTRHEQGSMVRQPTDVAAIVEQAIEQTSKAYEARTIKLKKTVVAAKVKVHEESVIQLVSIVLDNAAKYSRSRTTVELTGVRGSSTYRLTVRDNGAGIAAEDLPHIFERLYRGDKARSGKIEGFGLGLALAKEIAMANGATITATNHADGGAVFEIRLPI